MKGNNKMEKTPKMNIRLLTPTVFLAAILATSLYGKPKGNEWKPSQLIKPEELVKILSGKSPNKPLVLQVGFEVLYRGGHIDKAIYAGPAFSADGIAALKEAVKNIPKNKPIVLYCGCCPWNECPNIHPAFETMAKLGFKNVKVLYLPSSFRDDWIEKGYPSETVKQAIQK